jgi:hypothetical protein
MEVVHMELPETPNNLHDVPFYNVPTPLEKKPSEAIWAGCIIARHLIYGVAHLILGERVTHRGQVWVVKVNGIPMEVHCMHIASSHDRIEVTVDYLLFCNMVGNPPIIMLDALNVAFSSSSIHP